MMSTAGQGVLYGFFRLAGIKAPAPAATGANGSRLLTQAKQSADEDPDCRYRAERAERFFAHEGRCAADGIAGSLCGTRAAI